MLLNGVRLGLIPLMLLTCCFIARAEAIPKTLTFSYILDNEMQLTATKILSIAYGRLGIRLTFTGLPSKRALYQSDRGIVDGEVLRVSDVDKTYINLYQVPVSLYKMTGVAITSTKQTQFDHIGQLLKYRLAIHNGIYWQDQFISGFHGRYSHTGTVEKQLKLLRMNRVDYALVTRSSALKLMANKFKADNFVEVSPIISEFYLYHYLNKKHSSLISLVAKQLKIMAENGEMAKIWSNRLRHQNPVPQAIPITKNY